jgi:hypothetical protein
MFSFNYCFLTHYSVTKPCSLQVQPSGSVSLALLLNACLAQARLDFAPPTARGIREARRARRRAVKEHKKNAKSENDHWGEGVSCLHDKTLCSSDGLHFEEASK